MMLFWMLAILVAGGLLARAAGRLDDRLSRWIAVCALGADLVLVAAVWIHNYRAVSLLESRSWLIELRWDWIPGFGASFHLAMDGLSLILLALTIFLGLVAVVASWTEVRTRVGFFHFNLLWVPGGNRRGLPGRGSLPLLRLLGADARADVFPDRHLGTREARSAAFKFFLFTRQGAGDLLSILALYFIHGQATGVYTFEYAALAGTPLGAAAPRVMLGFLLAFPGQSAGSPVSHLASGRPRPGAHGGSVILAGLLKTGAYGLIRFVLPFPRLCARSLSSAWPSGWLAISTGPSWPSPNPISRGWSPHTSVSYMGFVLDPLSRRIGLQGRGSRIACHGLPRGAVPPGRAIQERLRMRSSWAPRRTPGEASRVGGAALLFALASLGLPGLGNLSRLNSLSPGPFSARRRSSPSWLRSVWIASTIYALSLSQRIFQGPKSAEAPFRGLGPRRSAFLRRWPWSSSGWVSILSPCSIRRGRRSRASSSAAPGRTMGIASARPASSLRPQAWERVAACRR